ncbi:PrsW family glutamic-type intramembrane protease [Sphingomonas lutea]|uniref:PrsW family glutamic-type intramembrane protease n=1 Tax=Sphingomonas lutea TaxID=1045317 RepID=UPI001CB727FC|nr:PrsW family glutamic-type intramembrane protease [Sphingomonas lutea]
MPVLILLAIFVSFDAFKLMSLREILLLLFLGALAAVASYPVSGRLLDTLPIGFSNYSRFYAPWIEEFIKGAVIVTLFRFNRIGFKLDAVLSGFAVGAGFSVLENMIYLVRLSEFGASTWLVRGLGTAVMHGTTLAILAATAHELAERETREAAGEFNFNLLWFVPGYLAAGGLHMLFNQFPDQPLLAMLGAAMFAPLAVVAIFTFGTAEAHSWLEKEKKQHQTEYQALHDGGWPPSSAGQRVATFARSLQPPFDAQVRRYWEVLAWLVVQAEETLLEEAAGDAAFDRAAIDAAFAELAALQASLGDDIFGAVKRMLPFSRNDYWELRELKQRIAKEE